MLQRSERLTGLKTAGHLDWAKELRVVFFPQIVHPDSTVDRLVIEFLDVGGRSASFDPSLSPC